MVGIVEDVRQWGLDRASSGEVLVDLRQWPDSNPEAGIRVFEGPRYFAVRTQHEPTVVVPTIRGILRQLDGDATLDSVVTMDRVLSNSVSRPRMYAVLLGLFAAVAAMLAAIGIYGVLAYSVTQRTREIGIRMALGATRQEVLALVVGQGAVLTGIGILLGLAGAAVVTRALETMLFGVSTVDRSTYAGVSLAFTLIASLAAYLPARRATQIDPMVALRLE